MDQIASKIDGIGMAKPFSGAASHKLAVVIPAYRVTLQILPLLAAIGDEVALIYVVDDACPEQSGALVAANCRDARVQVLFIKENSGVGGAMMAGYRQALADGATIIVKLDGDGQMDPRLISRFAAPIAAGRADYTKGNRFYNIEDVRGMPAVRLAGNAMLSFATKLSSGYWNIFDPTNGYTAISGAVLRQLPMDKISQRYFFESDMLFRLGTVRACVLDVPMPALYGDESSGLKIHRVVPEFFGKHMRNFVKRLVYNYFLRDFSIASLELVFGVALFVFGVVFGLFRWSSSFATGVPATTGTVMLAALPVILGIQLILSFLSFDINITPASAIHPLLEQGPATTGHETANDGH